MTVRVHRSDRSHHLVLRMSAGETLPAALGAKLGEERVACGWLRGSGVLVDVELRAFDAQLGGLAGARRLGGPVHVLAMESSVGLVGGEPAFSLRAVLARETDRGLETLAGEIVSARTVALEVLVTVLDDLALDHAVADSGIAMLDSAATEATRPQPSLPATRPQPGPPPTLSWSTVAEASAQTDREPAVHSRAPAVTVPVSVPMPQRPARPGLDLDAPVPEAGDVVDHFAFGRCDVIKSDGDRLHLRVHKDGRIREIALEMLRVTRLEGGGTGRQFKLERRL